MRRNDPLYRVMDLPPLVDKIDGMLKPIVARLDHISSLGLVSFLHGMARYPKSEHRYGTIHQVNQMIASRWFPDAHADAMLLAACFLHVGHCPFTYATERAFLRACRQDTDARRFLDQAMAEVAKVADLEEEFVHVRQQELLALEHAEELYRWLSAYQLTQSEAKVKNALAQIGRAKDERDGVCRKAVLNLADRTHRGWQYLDGANRADYVQRDGLYFGTVRLDISPKHLYERDFQEPSRATDEWSLVERNRTYLEERIYEPVQFRGNIAVFEHLLADYMICKGFTPEKLLVWDDDDLIEVLETGRTAGKTVTSSPRITNFGRSLVAREPDCETELVFKLPRVCYPCETPAELEQQLVDRTGRGVLAYPCQNGFVVECKPCSRRAPAPAGHRYFDVRFHAVGKEMEAERVFKCLSRLMPFYDLDSLASLQKALGQKLTLGGLCRIDAEETVRSVARFLEDLWASDDSRRSFKELRRSIDSLSYFDSLKRSLPNNFSLMTLRWLLEDTERGPGFSTEENLYDLGSILLAIPAKAWSFSDPQNFLQALSASAWRVYEKEADKGEKGRLFEALCLLERMKVGAAEEFWMYVNGLTLLDDGSASPHQRTEIAPEPRAEYDLIEVCLSDDTLQIDLSEASTDASGAKATAETQKLRDLMDMCHQAFPSAHIDTWLLRPGSSRQLKRTPVGSQKPAP